MFEVVIIGLSLHNWTNVTNVDTTQLWAHYSGFWRQGGVVNICNHQVFPFQLSELVERVLNEDKLCITLGGDHAIGIGTIQVLFIKVHTIYSQYLIKRNESKFYV